MSEELTPDQKMLNVGIEVLTKSLGKLVVKELPIESVQLLAQDIVNILIVIRENIGEENSEVDVSKVGIALVASPVTLKAVKALLGASTNKQSSDFDGIPLSDSLKLISAFTKANDMKELKELFFQLLPKNLLVDEQNLKN